jgi:hypothetical protein
MIMCHITVLATVFLIPSPSRYDPEPHHLLLSISVCITVPVTAVSCLLTAVCATAFYL